MRLSAASWPPTPAVRGATPHGTIGDYLIGVRAIDGCGAAFAGGGRVVKNAAGYNLPRLMVGSLGTLGVLTQLTFMVRPLPTHSALVICDMPSFQQAECLLAALGRSRTTPMIVELLTGPAEPHCPLPAKPDTAAARLAIGFEGGAAEVQGMANVLCDEWRALGADGLTTIIGARVDAVWNWLSESPAILQINVLSSRLVGVMEQVGRKPARDAASGPRGQRRGSRLSGRRCDGRRTRKSILR